MKTMITIQITNQDNGRECWNELLSLYLKAGTEFEVFCWKNEKEEIATALESGGVLENTNWEYGEVIKGILNEEFIQQILEWVSCEEDIYKKNSKFFAFNTGGIWSEHYGAEIYIEQEPENKAALYQLLDKIAPFVKILQVTEGVG